MNQQELLSTQNSADQTHTNKQDSSKPIHERVQLPGTPFWIVGNQETGYHLTMGKYKLTQEPFKTKDDVQIWLLENQWNVTLSVALCAASDINEQEYKKLQQLKEIEKTLPNNQNQQQ